MIDTACWRNSRLARSVRKHDSEENMRAETERRSLGARGDPEFGAWFVYASILIVDDERTLSSMRTRHRADPCAGRYRCEHRITAFRHSVGGFARRAPHATAAASGAPYLARACGRSRRTCS